MPFLWYILEPFGMPHTKFECRQVPALGDISHFVRLPKIRFFDFREPFPQGPNGTRKLTLAANERYDDVDTAETWKKWIITIFRRMMAKLREGLLFAFLHDFRLILSQIEICRFVTV